MVLCHLEVRRTPLVLHKNQVFENPDGDNQSANDTITTDNIFFHGSDLPILLALVATAVGPSALDGFKRQLRQTIPKHCLGNDIMSGDLAWRFLIKKPT